MPYCFGSLADGEPFHRIYYEVYGDDTAPHKVIFTMGLGGDYYQWEPQTEFFERVQNDDEHLRFQFVVYDNRGMGFSDPVPGRWTTTSMAKDGLALLDHLGWNENCHIVGLSMGGMISQELALLDLKRFRSLTLISTIAGGLYSLGLFALSIPTGLRTLVSTFLSSDPRNQLKSGLKLLYPEEFLDKQVYNEEKGEHEPYFRAFRRALIRRGVETTNMGMPPRDVLSLAKQGMAVATHHVSPARLETLAQHFRDAILVITGDKDILVHPGNAYVLRDGLQAHFLELPIAGHGANEQYPEEVNHAILDNIRRGAHQNYRSRM